MSSLLSVVQRILEHREAGTLTPGFQAPIRRGSAAGHVSVVANPDEPSFPVIRVSLEVIRVPADGQARFFRRLLELNQGLDGRAAFSVSDDGLASLISGRSAEGLDPGELIDLILWTAEQADRLDDLLLAEFGPEHAP